MEQAKIKHLKLPIILFWFLNAYYLMQESKFRKLYNIMVSAESNLEIFEMNIHHFNTAKFFFKRPLFSLYMVMILIVMGVFFLILMQG